MRARVWDLTQVLNPGMPMSQEGDRTLFGRQVLRITDITCCRGRNPGAVQMLLETGFTFSLTTPDPQNCALPISTCSACMRPLCESSGGWSSSPSEEEDFGSWDGCPQLQMGKCGGDFSYPLRCFLVGSYGTVSRLTVPRWLYYGTGMKCVEFSRLCIVFFGTYNVFDREAAQYRDVAHFRTLQTTLFLT